MPTETRAASFEVWYTRNPARGWELWGKTSTRAAAEERAFLIRGWGDGESYRAEIKPA